MQKIWDSESNQTLYIMNQSKVDEIVNKKSNNAHARANYVEGFIIIMNVVVPLILLLIGGLHDTIGFGEYSFCGFALITVIATLIYRRNRIKSQPVLGDSMLDNLDHAIHNATHQARMTGFFLIWYIVGVGVLSIYNLILEEANIWFIIGMTIVFVIGLIVGRWEQRCWHERKRDELISLRNKLRE